MGKRDPGSKASSAVSASASVLIGVLVLYMLPFIVVLLDEAVFRTGFVASNLPPWCEKAFEIVYWPILVVLR